MDYHDKSVPIPVVKNILALYPCFLMFLVCLCGGVCPIKNYFLKHLLWLV